MVAPEGRGKSQQLVVVTRHETGFERVVDACYLCTVD